MTKKEIQSGIDATESLIKTLQNQINKSHNEDQIRIWRDSIANKQWFIVKSKQLLKS